MSLVNKMLRDLDTRRAASGERAGLPSAVTPLSARQEAASGKGLWIGVLLLLLVGAAVGWWFFIGAPQPTPPAPPVAVPPAPTSAPVAIAQPKSPAPSGGDATLQLDMDLDKPPVGRPAARTEISTAKPKPAQEKAPAVTAAPFPPARPPVVALPREVPGLSTQEPRIDKQSRQPTAAERAEAEYRRGVLSQRQGQTDEAVIFYRVALAEHAEHAAARQTLAALLMDLKRLDEAEEVLLKGTELPSVRHASTLALARLKVERGQAPAALDLLLKNADAGARSGDYQGFIAALLNRVGRHREAVERYQAATMLAPNEGRWWAGLGIALDAEGKTAEAREAYQRARGLPGLPAELSLHIDQRLR